MRTPRTQTLIIIGILIGLVVGMTLASTISFDSGDAGKVSDGVTFESQTGTEVTIEGTTNVSMDDVFLNSSAGKSEFADRSVQLNTSDGNITIASDNAVSATVHTSNLTGEWTNLTDMTAGGNWMEIYPQEKDQVDTKGDVNDLSLANMSVGDGNIDFWFNGTDGGTVTVVLYNLTTNTQITAADANDGSYLDHNTSDGSGELWLHLPASSHNVELLDKNTTFNATHTNPDPTGFTPNDPSELSIDINDSDFPEDDVEVNISLDGTQKKSTNITSNQTVTASVGNLDLGQHNWTVNTTDIYGNFNSSNYSFTLPRNITLRNETNASQVIKDKNVTATFYSENGEVVVQRSDDNKDGNISLEGLPDTDFVVTFEGEGWYDRRVYIESIFDQQNIFLLNSTAYPTADDDAIETTFVYSDRTDEFGQADTTLQIQRAVDVDNDGNFNWTTIAGDFWGAAGEFPFTGEYQERYRLIIKNQETGDERTLGTHIPVDDGVKNIIVGNIIFDHENATGRYWDAEINESSNEIEIYYQDPKDQTSDLQIRVYEHGNESNEIYNQTVSGSVGIVTRTVGLTEDQTDKNWIVEFSGDHSDDGSVYGEIIVGSNNFVLPMDSDILAALLYSMITFIMALYGPRTAIAGAWAGVFLLFGIMLLGWIEISIAAATIAFIAASGGTLYKEAMPT